LLFVVFFPVVFLRTCLRLTLHRRWDGLRAAISGLSSFGLSVGEPFVDELGAEGIPHAEARSREAEGLKVAVVEPVGGHGGMDYYDFSLCEGLSKAGASVTLYTCDETLLEEEGGAKPYRVRLPYRGIYGPDAAWRRGARYVLGSLRALLGARSDGARLAHLHLFHVGPLELFNAVLARVLGLRLVVTAHDVRPFAGGLSFPMMARMVYGMANRVIAHGRVGSEELSVVLGLPEDRVVVIPHGNYLRFVGRVPPAKEARARLGLPTAGKVLLFFGQIKEVKGLEVLIEAMPEVLLEHPDAMLVIAGKVWKDDFGRYRNQMERLGVAESCVTHLRYVPRSETADYYAAADLVVLPYKRIYQSGVLLMAMSYGKAVVVSDLPGMTEVVTDGSNGLVFPSGGVGALAAKIIGALSDPEASRAVGERGLAYVKEHHDWDRIGQATSECYRAALDG
jgi:glycosyltransferase involved in cell wall biosynthesis